MSAPIYVLTVEQVQDIRRKESVIEMCRNQIAAAQRAIDRLEGDIKAIKEGTYIEPSCGQAACSLRRTS